LFPLCLIHPITSPLFSPQNAATILCPILLKSSDFHRFKKEGDMERKISTAPKMPCYSHFLFQFSVIFRMLETKKKDFK